MDRLKKFFSTLFANFSFDSFLISTLVIKVIIFDVSWISVAILFLLLADKLIRKIISYLEAKRIDDEEKRSSKAEYLEFQKNVLKEMDELKGKVNRTNAEFNVYRQGRTR